MRPTPSILVLCTAALAALPATTATADCYVKTEITSSGLAGIGGESDHRGNHVKGKSRNHQLPVPDPVRQQAADNDAETESGKAGASDLSKLGPGEAELPAPVVKNSPADGKTDPGRENSHKSGP